MAVCYRLHRRIAKMKGIADNNWDRTDYYYTTSWQVIEERLAAGRTDETKGNVATSAKYQYVWSLRYIDAAICRDENTDTDQDNDCTDAGGSERLYYANGGNMEVTALLSASGAVVERYVYDPYGKVTIYDDDWSQTVAWANSKKNEILYCGYRHNPETGLYQVRYRDLHPTMAWMQRDARGYVDGQNVYEYVRSEPQLYCDPFGLDSNTPVSRNVCGPDVTEWFRLELARQAGRRSSDATTDAGDLFRFRYQVKYLLAYKWMSFDVPGCGTGRCKHTVMLNGVCLRKNQLGNIMYGYLSAWRPPQGLLGRWTTSETIAFAYRQFGTYDPAHPHAAQFGRFAGKPRSDNLAAFGVGAHLGRQGAKAADIYNLAQVMKNLAVLNTFKSLYPTGPGTNVTLTSSTLTFVPTPEGGFDTMGCEACRKDANSVSWPADSPSAIDTFEKGLWVKYVRDHDRFPDGVVPGTAYHPKVYGDQLLDEWLEKNYENYGE